MVGQVCVSCFVVSPAAIKQHSLPSAAPETLGLQWFLKSGTFAGSPLGGGSGSGAAAYKRQDHTAGTAPAGNNKSSGRGGRNRTVPEGGCEGTAKVDGRTAKIQVNGTTTRQRATAAAQERLQNEQPYYEEVPPALDRGDEEEVEIEDDPPALDEDLEDDMAGADGVSAEGLSGDRALKEDEASTAPVPKKV